MGLNTLGRSIPLSPPKRRSCEPSLQCSLRARTGLGAAAYALFRLRSWPQGYSPAWMSCRLQLQRLDPRKLLAHTGGRPRLPKIVRRLLRQPHLSSTAVVATQPTLNAQGHRRADCSPPVEHLGQSGPVNTQLGSCCADLQIQGRQDVVSQGEARVGRVEHVTHRRLSGNLGNPIGLHRRFQTQMSGASFHSR